MTRDYNMIDMGAKERKKIQRKKEKERMEKVKSENLMQYASDPIWLKTTWEKSAKEHGITYAQFVENFIAKHGR